jgi:hypothetical protein
MLATADAATCETMGEGHPGGASGITGGGPAALWENALVADKNRLATDDRQTVPAAARSCAGSDGGPGGGRSRPPVAPASKTGEPVEKSCSEPAAIAFPDGPVSTIPLARWRGGSTHRTHRRHPVVPKVTPLYDPNDDTGSDDPDEDDDEMSTSLDDSDDSDVPNIAGLEERAQLVMPHECAAVTWPVPPASFLLTLQRLRC